MTKQNFQHTIFTTPIWIFDMLEHDTTKDVFLETIDSYIEKQAIRENNFSASSVRTVTNIHHNTQLRSLIDTILRIAPVIKEDYNLEDKVGIGIREMWGTKTQSYGIENVDSTHRGLISGLYFLDTPPDSGELEIENPASQPDYFTFPTVQSTGFNQSTHKLKIPEGKIFLFPSHLKHKLSGNKNKNSARTIIHFTLCTA